MLERFLDLIALVERVANMAAAIRMVHTVQILQTLLKLEHHIGQAEAATEIPVTLSITVATHTTKPTIIQNTNSPQKDHEIKSATLEEAVSLVGAVTPVQAFIREEAAVTREEAVTLGGKQ